MTGPGSVETNVKREFMAIAIDTTSLSVFLSSFLLSPLTCPSNSLMSYDYRRLQLLELVRYRLSRAM